MSVFITATDVQVRLSVQAFTRLFAKSGGPNADRSFLDLCVSEANFRATMITKDQFPAGFAASDNSIDDGIKGLVVDICCGIAASRHASSDPTIGAYAKNRDTAEKFLERLNRKQDARPATAAVDLPRSQASNTNLTDAAGQPTNPFVRAGDGTDSSDF